MVLPARHPATNKPVRAGFITPPSPGAARLEVMTLSRLYLLLLPLALGACTLFGGNTSPLSETCYTDPQPPKAAQPAPKGGQVGGEAGAYVPGRLLVAYRDADAQPPTLGPTAEPTAQLRDPRAALEAAARSVRRSYGLQRLGALGGDRLEDAGADALEEIVRVPRGVSVPALAAQLRRDPRVRYAEPDYYLYPLRLPAPSNNAPTDTPADQPTNDPLLFEQWHLRDFGVHQAWRLETGRPHVVLAVLDSGVDLTHEDLRGRTLPGCDVYNQDNDPSPGTPSQLGADQRHGTHVAGIAVASGNNGKGVAGVAYTGVRLLPVKVFDDSGGDSRGTATSVVTRAIRWSAGLSVEGMNRNPYPANIINLSLGGKGYVESLNDAVQDARDAGTLVVAASGNEHLTGEILTPANAPGALAVGSVDATYERSSFSNYSTTGRTVDLMAPGGIGDSSCGAVFSTLSPAFEGATESAYGCERGTSMAAPFVAGVAALIWSQNPELSADEVEARLLGSTHYAPFMNRAEYGAGVICADRALGAATLCGQ